MKQSFLFGKTRVEDPKDETSINAKLLMRAGFVDKLAAGIYSYLPLGLRVLYKIQNIVREEMNAIGGQELLLPALHPRASWEQTGRWNEDVMFKTQGHGGQDYGLGWTHEEIITPLVARFVSSHKDLPLALYQMQTKFRNEPRAKSGILRGREFNMKDLYSFHRDTHDLDAFYERALQAYSRVFERCGIPALVVEASGGSFSKYSHEFQMPTDSGEDIVYSCSACGRHQNKEIVEGNACPSCGGDRQELKAIEVGNIFKLGTRFSEPCGLRYADEQGKEQPVIMGCYGIGPSRVMGSVVEASHDTKGIIWPETVAPFKVHIVALGSSEAVISTAGALYTALHESAVDVLYDDRDMSAGAKFADSDLIGIPYRVVVSERTLKRGSVELKKRRSDETILVDVGELVRTLSK